MLYLIYYQKCEIKKFAKLLRFLRFSQHVKCEKNSQKLPVENFLQFRILPTPNQVHYILKDVKTRKPQKPGDLFIPVNMQMEGTGNPRGVGGVCGN